MKAGPYYSLYLNPLGRGRTGYYFPHEEFADAGLRPTIFKICKEAPAGSVVGGEAPPYSPTIFTNVGEAICTIFSLSDCAIGKRCPRRRTWLLRRAGNISTIFLSFRPLHPRRPRLGLPLSPEFRPQLSIRTSELTELRNGHESNVTLR